MDRGLEGGHDDAMPTPTETQPQPQPLTLALTLTPTPSRQLYFLSKVHDKGAEKWTGASETALMRQELKGLMDKIIEKQEQQVRRFRRWGWR